MILVISITGIMLGYIDAAIQAEAFLIGGFCFLDGCPISMMQNTNFLRSKSLSQGHYSQSLGLV